MLNRVFEMKKWMLICVIALIIILFLKILIPVNDLLIRETLSFLGLGKNAVQALGRSLNGYSS